MRYHVALGRHQDLAGMDLAARDGKNPRHVMWALTQRLGATIHSPQGLTGTTIDRLRSKVAGGAVHWALARSLSGRLGPDDLVFCTGEDVGLPVAATLGKRRGGPKVVVFVHNLDRPRGRVALKLFGAARKVDLFVTNTSVQADFLRDFLRLPESRVAVILDQTDTKFFTPGPASPGKARPVIASVGLEKRDYRTLAEATQDLDVDVKISAFSPDAKAESRMFPETMPANMSRRFFEWPEMVQLYRDADVVALSLFPNDYTAGVNVLMEAWACRRPVVLTRTRGLVDYVADDPDAVTCSAPGDAADLRRAIVGLLSDRGRADAQAERGYRKAINGHDSDSYVERMTAILAGA
jgi:glycosyltransferase involved in cell wall biosynthesis